MKTFSMIFAIIATFALCGCVQQQPKIIQLQSTLTEGDLKHFEGIGKNTVRVNAFLRKADGSVVTCAGSESRLTPVTAYATERMQSLYGNTSHGFREINQQQVLFTPELSSYRSSEKKSMCNSQGIAIFENIPDGDYYATTIIYWFVPFNAHYTDKQGGFLMQRVSVAGGQLKEVILSY